MDESKKPMVKIAASVNKPMLRCGAIFTLLPSSNYVLTTAIITRYLHALSKPQNQLSTAINSEK